MKKVLLGTTALIAGGLAAVPAMAADPIKIGVSGYMQQYFAVGHMGGLSHGGAGGLGTDFRTPTYYYEGEVWFIGQTKLDNGTTVGVRVELEAWTQSFSATAAQIDETYIFAFGDWGRFTAGSNNPVDYIMSYGAPNALMGYGSTQFNFAAGSATGSGANGANHSYAWAPGIFGNDASKLNYYTPRFYGLQLGVTYTPYIAVGAASGVANAAATCGFQSGAGNAPFCANAQNAYVNQVSIAANYVNKFGDFGVAAYIGWDHATYDAGIIFDATRANQNAVAGGLQLSYAGFTVGGSFGWDNNGLVSGNENLFWSAGVMYETGPWAVSFTYFGGTKRESTTALAGPGGAAGTDQVHLLMAGGSYALGPGIKLYGGGFYEIASGQTQSERTNSWQFLLGTELRF